MVDPISFCQGALQSLNKAPDSAGNNPVRVWGKEYQISLRCMVLLLSTVVLRAQGKI